MAIREVQATFVAEASAAPSLFADLAKVELYIAESYRSRAFIELLQNADDAGARRFQIHQVKDKLIVANDGRPFSNSDIVALCRSGASNKQRGTGTIGYRGIGFKSVAGIAHEIAVVSDAYSFIFSKSKTQQLLGLTSDVPLIRIPHPATEHKAGLEALVAQPLSEGFSTIFVLSGLDERRISEEVETFDESAMLFLAHVSEVDIQLSAVKRHLVRAATVITDGLSVERIEDAAKRTSSSWVVASADRQAEKVAFAYENGAIIPASPQQSVVHAFMPTTEFSGALLKLHGDFSTDPSRKTIDMDAASTASFGQCVAILGALFQSAILLNRLPGIFNPFALVAPIEGRFRKLLRESILAWLDTHRLTIAGRQVKPLDIRLHPDWLGYSDYEILCSDVAHVPHSLVTTHPALPEFLRWLGARPLAIEEAISLIGKAALSPAGCAQLFYRAAKHYRYDLTEARIEMLSASPLLATEGGMLSPGKYEGDALVAAFTDYLKQQPESDDIRYLARRLKLPDGLLGASSGQLQNGMPAPSYAGSVSTCASKETTDVAASPFKAAPAIKAWRSAEQNAIAWLSALRDVVAANDVSQANVGYDIEVIRRNGEREYVEVKSVPRFGDAFRLTNNEHATAYQLGSSYLLALVVNGSDQFHIRFIRDPVRTLKLEKRCEQWSWYSEEYLSFLTEMMEETRDSNS